MRDRYIVRYFQVKTPFNQFVFSTANNQNIKKGLQLTKSVQTSECFSPAELLPESELACSDAANTKEGILPKIVSSIKNLRPSPIHLSDCKMQSLCYRKCVIYMCKYMENTISKTFCSLRQDLPFQKYTQFFQRVCHILCLTDSHQLNLFFSCHYYFFEVFNNSFSFSPFFFL